MRGQTGGTVLEGGQMSETTETTVTYLCGWCSRRHEVGRECPVFATLTRRGATQETTHG